VPPAARVTDMHVCPMVTGVVPHVGGPILPPGVPTVLIGFLPAATVTNMLTCVGPPDVIVKGSMGVFINFLPAARMGDLTAHGGVIVLGEPTVMIGEIGAPSPGAGGMGGITAGLALSGVSTPIDPNASVYGKGAAQGSAPASPPAATAPAAAAPAPVQNPDPVALMNTPVNGITPVDVLPGTNGKVAIIGRSMADAVNPYAAGLAEKGLDVETFAGDQISPEAVSDWESLKNDYAPNYIPPDKVVESKMFQNNKAWAQKLVDKGYTIVNVGNPGNLRESPFFEMEQKTIFGK
jgi:uncharacterized Zn-binding protein involved in type VI secretion